MSAEIIVVQLRKAQAISKAISVRHIRTRKTLCANEQSDV